MNIQNFTYPGIPECEHFEFRFFQHLDCDDIVSLQMHQDNYVHMNMPLTKNPLMMRVGRHLLEEAQVPFEQMAIFSCFP